MVYNAGKVKENKEYKKEKIVIKEYNWQIFDYNMLIHWTQNSEDFAILIVTSNKTSYGIKYWLILSIDQ